MQHQPGSRYLPTMPDAPVPRDPRWLTEEQQRQWRSYLMGSARLANVLAEQLWNDSELSFNEYEVLVRLSETPGRRLRMSQLADELVHSRSRLTHTVTRMEKRGLVARVPSCDDRRGIDCTLTDRGFDTLVAAAPGHVTAVRENLVDLLDEETFAALGNAMRIVMEALEKR